MSSTKYHIGGYYWSTIYHKTLILDKIEGEALKLKDAEGKAYQELNGNTLIWVEKPIPDSNPPKPETPDAITSGEPDVNGRRKRSDYDSKMHKEMRKYAKLTDGQPAAKDVEGDSVDYIGYNFMIEDFEFSGKLLLHASSLYHRQIRLVRGFLKQVSKNNPKTDFGHFLDLDSNSILQYVSKSLQLHCDECVRTNMKNGKLTIERQDKLAEAAMERDMETAFGTGSIGDIIAQILKPQG